METEIGWQYVDTFGDYQRIKGWYSFYPSRVYCYLGKEMVRAQAGGYYGGWISPEVVGALFKRGSGHGRVMTIRLFEKPRDVPIFRPFVE
ncbi:MAG: hypothetical protein CM1200mP24_07390 [Gammaproteobacteria bacterium]|nr:MAG: hypothetical protein CM1200mP24_07390 [Gammaproteobacteria bacterium]